MGSPAVSFEIEPPDKQAQPKFEIEAPASSTPPRPMATLSARDTSHPVQNWLEDLAGDLRYGGRARTLPGRVASWLMPNGMTAGKPPGVTEFAGGPVLGPIKAAQGVTEMREHPVRGAADVVRGAAQTAALPMAVLAPETTAMSLPRSALGVGVSRASRALGANEDVSDLLGAGAAAGGPAAGRGLRFGANKLGTVMENNAGKVAEFAAHPVSTTVKPIVRGGIRQTGRLLQRMTGPTAETPAVTPPAATGATSEAVPAPSPLVRARQMQVAGEGMPMRPATADEQAFTDAMANFGVPSAEAAVPVAPPIEAPKSMAGFYGKTPTRSNLKANQRQLASPTASTAPLPAAYPERIMNILKSPVEPTDADILEIQRAVRERRLAGQR